MNDIAHTMTLPYSESTFELLHPISQDSSVGDDLSYSILFDEIREARRSDDMGLTQREWATEIKTADWGLVRALCENALKTRTKDLQIAAWYAEAMIYLEGFSGLAQGLELLHGLMTRYWESCYPSLENSDLDERCAKVEWLNTQLPFALQKIPVTQSQDGVYTYLQWKESRWVENTGLKDAKAKLDAIADGKLSGEFFDKAARQSGIAFYEVLLKHSEHALSAVDMLNTIVEEKFGNAAPSLSDLRNTVVECVSLARRLYADVGGRTAAVVDFSSHPLEQPPGVTASIAKPYSIGTISSRQDAVQALRSAAQYFYINEPHSPVALLADRAARWAEMSLAEWLGTVIKDDGTLGQLRELLDIQTES